MKFLPITQDHYPEVLIHLRNTFFRDEPLNKSLNLYADRNGIRNFEPHMCLELEQGLSVMALSDENEIAGVCLNHVVLPDYYKKILSELETDSNDKFQKIFSVLCRESENLDLFRRYEVDRIFAINIISVDFKFRCQGIAKQLIGESEKVARKHGFMLIKADATSLYSERLLATNQFESISERRYDSILNADGSQMFSIEPPHERISIMIKKTKIAEV